MTSTTLDWRSLRAKLRKISELLADLKTLGDIDLARISEDRMTGLAIERVLTLVVDLAVSINSHVCAVELDQTADSYAASFPLAAKAGVIDKKLAEQLEPSAGLRNILVHNYIEIDYTIVVRTIPLALQQYGQYVTQVARWLANRDQVSEDEQDPQLDA